MKGEQHYWSKIETKWCWNTTIKSFHPTKPHRVISELKIIPWTDYTTEMIENGGMKRSFVKLFVATTEDKKHILENHFVTWN